MKQGAKEKVRAFIAVELPPDIKDALKSVQDLLRKTGADVRWVRPEGIHLTLKFLGDMDASIVDDLAGALKGSLEGRGAVGLRLGGTGVFPNRRAPRVVWAGLDGDVDRLAELAEIVEGVCEGFGFERETRPFKPHLTLGRVKSRRGTGALLDVLDEAGKRIDRDFGAQHVCLIRSELRPTGAVYTVLAQILLG